MGDYFGHFLLILEGLKRVFCHPVDDVASVSERSGGLSKDFCWISEIPWCWWSICRDHRVTRNRLNGPCPGRHGRDSRVTRNEIDGSRARCLGLGSEHRNGWIIRDEVDGPGAGQRKRGSRVTRNEIDGSGGAGAGLGLGESQSRERGFGVGLQEEPPNDLVQVGQLGRGGLEVLIDLGGIGLDRRVEQRGRLIALDDLVVVRNFAAVDRRRGVLLPVLLGGLLQRSDLVLQFGVLLLQRGDLVGLVIDALQGGELGFLGLESLIEHLPHGLDDGRIDRDFLLGVFTGARGPLDDGRHGAIDVVRGLLVPVIADDLVHPLVHDRLTRLDLSADPGVAHAQHGRVDLVRGHLLGRGIGANRIQNPLLLGGDFLRQSGNVISEVFLNCLQEAGQSVTLGFDSARLGFDSIQNLP